jgi:hypothetical protein
MTTATAHSNTEHRVHPRSSFFGSARGPTVVDAPLRRNTGICLSASASPRYGGSSNSVSGAATGAPSSYTATPSSARSLHHAGSSNSSSSGSGSVAAVAVLSRRNSGNSGSSGGGSGNMGHLPIAHAYPCEVAADVHTIDVEVSRSRFTYITLFTS